MAHYKNLFTENENNIFNTIERETTRKSLMSVYAYLISKTEQEIKLGRDGILNFSFRKFLKNYNRGHRYLSLGSLKNRIDTLVTLGLLKVTKVKQSCIYKLNRFLNSSKVTQSTENTRLEINSSEHKYINNNINIDIDLYSNSKKEFNSDMYEKCTSLVDVRRKVKELLISMKVKNSWIKNRVLTKVSESYRNITVKFLENYILKAIEDARSVYKNNWIKYAKVNSKTLRRANFTQREYDWNTLEKGLLGW